MYGSSDPRRPERAAAAPAGLPLWCATCRSGEHLMLHSIDSLPAHTGELLVHVLYACTACGSFQGHAAPFRQVAALLNESATVPGVLCFGDMYLHCGKPMTVAGTADRSIQAPLHTQETPDPGLPDVVLTTKTLQCTCGFRIELPD
ncbi:hypothetical protein [Arthrobacter sp. AZCC_0090]|uniref:hypothetical protein n=1 Tax=Arthrobacter sp. AZCC_0090 TaxID=2735881 RepID=UPI00161B25C6|nr:hypothetical protein [Arthrobacter sp. AZCC_0090]MBB6402870.1 hypothetical protein [Arthrobacter sp. AZCC_0090]